MIAVSVTADDNLDVVELQTELAHRVLDDGDVGLVGGVDEDGAVRSVDDKGRQRLGADIVKVADDAMRGELLSLLLACSDIAGEELRDGPDVSGLLGKQDRREKQ